MSDDNMQALVLLLRLFRDLSTEPIQDDEEFAREVELRWKLWRDVEGWTLKAGGSLDGYFELHLREAVLGVRVFRNQPSGEPECIAKLRILLNGQGLVNSSIWLAPDDSDARIIAYRLMEAIASHGQLEPLEWSMARALQPSVRQSLALEVQ